MMVLSCLQVTGTNNRLFSKGRAEINQREKGLQFHAFFFANQSFSLLRISGVVSQPSSHVNSWNSKSLPNSPLRK